METAPPARGSHAAYLICGALLLVPFARAADLPPTWAAAIAALALAGLLPGGLGRVALILASVHAVYLGAASAPAQPLRTVLGLVALATLILAQPPSRRLGAALLAVAVATPLGLVVAVLSRSTWTEEAAAMQRIASGLTLAGVALVVAHTLAERQRHGAIWPLRLMAVAVLLAAGATSIGIPRGHAGALPAWRPRLAALDSALPGSGTAQQRAWSILDRLRAAGDADAAYAQVTLALEENADPLSLREGCPAGGRRGSLAGVWHDAVGVAALACAAVTGLPERGAETLERSLAGAGGDALSPTWGNVRPGRPGQTTTWAGALSRLAGDLWLEAGATDRAIAAVRRAQALGDSVAPRNLVRALLDRGRADLARSEAPVSDPLVASWLGDAPDEASAWAAWNESMDFSSREPPRRRGLIDSGAPGEISSRWSAELSRLVAAVPSKYGSAYRIQWSAPGSVAVPAELRLHVRSRGGFAVTLVDDRGERLTFGCGNLVATAGERFVAIDSPACGGQWDTVVLAGAALGGGSLTGGTFAGSFDLASITAVVAEARP